MMSICVLKAQTNDRQEAMQLVIKNSAAIGLTTAAVDDALISDSYYDQNAGVRMVYLQQAFKGIPVYNQLLVLAFKNGKLVSRAGSFIESLDKKVTIKTAIPTITPETAVMAAIADRKLISTQSPVLLSKAENNKFEYGNLGVSRQNITAQLAWVPSEKDQSVHLAWQVYIIPQTTADYWMIRVDAANNHILGMDNYTVYCNWDTPANKDHFGHEHKTYIPALFDFTYSSPKKAVVTNNSPSIVNNASYRVVPYPAESPIHSGGAHALVTNPWAAAPGNATSLKWNSNGTTDFTITRGNNVLAQEDRNNNNGTGAAATSTTSPDPLTFDFTPVYTVVPTQTTPVPNQQFNTTNLFYWNNIVHDLTYLYGMDEASGNFQDNNQGRGGLGADYVLADAQDGGGTNNANFSTPPDGSNGRMQMYLWNGSPQKDGDVDNGIVVHEYAHGISNRLTGGPGQSGCLGSAEQMGEGWSDYYGLMYTQNWATSTLTTGFSSPRGVGSYAIGQGPNGGGIRNQKYCTNFAVNNQVYAASISTESHNRGEIWCATLWDMTWDIINQVGSINANLYNSTGGGGNTIALRLVTEGLKLQPCSPGFIDGRDAILQADQLLYGGVHSCVIREAFRRRGMGAFASQGSSASVADQIPDFTAGGASVTLTQSGMTQVPEGGQITYTNTVTTTPCAPLSNFLLTDTLPTNVTWISGGNYNTTTRVVSFPVNVAAAQAQNYVFTVQVNAGAYFPTISLFEDNVPGPTLPATIWTANSTTNTNWVLSNARSRTAPNSYYSFNRDTQSDQKLFFTNTLALGATPPPLSFWHWYSAESTYDGGVLEISTNGGTTWTDMGPNILSGGYTGTMDGTTLIPGRRAWTGSSNNKFIKTKVNLTPYANQNVKFRFRFTSDVGTNLEGWYIDDIAVKSVAVVEMQTNFFTQAGVKVATADTVTIITPPVTCNSVALTAQPASTSACAGSNAIFSIAATGDSPSYQWQVSTNGGTTYTTIAGATGTTLSLSNVDLTMNGNLYQIVISNTCPSNITSTAALLNVGEPAAITAQPVSTTVCAGGNAGFTVTAAGASNTYQWQVSIDNGVTFTDITGATAATLTLPTVTGASNNNQYHVVIGSCNPGGLNSANVILTVNTPPTFVNQPVNITACNGTNAVFSIAATGTNVTYQWQVSTDNGATYTVITGATTNSLTITGVSASVNNNLYNVIINGTCPAAVTSTSALLTVSNNASITAQPLNTIACAGSTASFSATASGISYQWQVSTDNGATFTDIAGANTTLLDLTNVSASMNNNQYQLQVASCSATGLTSTPAILTVNDPATVSTQPVNSVTCLGADATFTVTASGAAVAYQWEVSTDGGISYLPIAGATASSLTVTAVTTALNNTLYRVVLSNTCTVNFTSNAATLVVTSAAVISAAPVNAITCSGTSTAFSVTASGTGLSYQWQVSTDNGATFTDMAGETGVSLNLTAVTLTLNNNQYRVVVFNPCSATGSISSIATLTVNSLPVVEITAAPFNNISIDQTTTLTATATPPATIFSWYNGGVLLSGVTGNTITVNHDALGSYTASVSDANNCTNISNQITIGDSTVNIAFIFPNPNDGFFWVTYKDVPFNGQPRFITMYDAKGARVYSKAHYVAVSYQKMEVHAERLSTGVYVLVLTDAAGNTLGSGKVVIRF